VADPAFGLDDTDPDPDPATGAPQGANDPVRWPHGDVFAREADEADPPSASIKDEAAADLPETESSWP
jgi:hypothetical protein